MKYLKKFEGADDDDLYFTKMKIKSDVDDILLELVDGGFKIEKNSCLGISNIQFKITLSRIYAEFTIDEISDVIIRLREFSKCSSFYLHLESYSGDLPVFLRNNYIEKIKSISGAEWKNEENYKFYKFSMNFTIEV